MLTTAAWNAFLKTLEEPPPHTIFVLATTEANKVLPTVVDRCHRFDFARPTQRPDRRRAAPRRRRGGDRDPRRGVRADRPLGHRLVPRRARARSSSSSPTRARPSRSTTCSPCSAPPTPTCCSAPSTRSTPATPRAALLAAARLADSGRDVGRFFGDLEAHLRGLMIVQTLGEVPEEIRVTARAGRAAGRAGPAHRPGRGAAAARPRRERAARDEGRRRPAHPARARAREGRPARARPVAARADWRGWSGSRPAGPPPRRRRPRRAPPGVPRHARRAGRAAQPPRRAPPRAERRAAAPRPRRPPSSPRPPRSRARRRSPRWPSSSPAATCPSPRSRVGVELDLPGPRRAVARGPRARSRSGRCSTR